VINKYVAWISLVAWILAVGALFLMQGNEIANAVVLITSFWLMFVWWRFNMQRGRL